MPSTIVPGMGSEGVEHDDGPETDPEKAPPGDSAPKGPSEGDNLFSLQRLTD